MRPKLDPTNLENLPDGFVVYNYLVDGEWESLVFRDGTNDFYIVTNGLAGIPLFSWYIFYTFVSPELVGTTFMDDLRAGMQGPYESKEQALEELFSLPS